MKKILSKARKEINSKLCSFGNYHQQIPLNDAFDVLKAHGAFPVQEDGTPWSGILCGREGSSRIDLVNENGEELNNMFVFSWYKLERSGNYEFVSYVS